MRFRERSTRDSAPVPADVAAPANAEANRDRATRLLEIGDGVIGRSLSGDSQSFLDQTQQHGGQ